MTEPVEHEASAQPDQEIPVCLKCLTPYPPLQHYCRKCGETVGQLSPYIPYVSIPFNVSIFQTMWKRTWLKRGAPLRWKMFYVLMFIVFAPIMIVGLPYVMITKLRRKKPPKDDAQ